MENATQALRIAAGVLFALLILGLLVAFYNNMSELKRYEQAQTASEQSADFNKQYDVYNRTLYGSELLSLVNKADNYNKTEVIDKGYPKMEVTVTYKNNISGFDSINNQEYIIFTKGKENNINDIKKAMSDLENKIREFGDMVHAGKKVSELALMRTNELDDFFENNGIRDNARRNKFKFNIRMYTMYKSTQGTIKNKKYKCTNVEYDETTGRIIKMSYKEQ